MLQDFSHRQGEQDDVNNNDRNPVENDPSFAIWVGVSTNENSWQWMVCGYDDRINPASSGRLDAPIRSVLGMPKMIPMDTASDSVKEIFRNRTVRYARRAPFEGLN